MLRASNTDKSADWHEFHPRPATVGALQMMMRLFWNPDRNEELFVVSCAERIQLQPTAHSINEIRRRILPEIEKRSLANPDTYFQFRLVFVHRDQNDLVQEVVFLSDRFATVDPQS
ncbi:hypothetical protein Z948_218 [Sulfitobacter donghicola DSW-25 = KCTC 12864 = JCM 14565]|uniref:Uncharacterized protein n=1 Tax=Sulfitobacter donghicola DSW-25 = KCTC 12864 = JCM 14565 TaxID=1300350 RepID=A0A073IBQ5_9RHOB|nr:hypothetical protein DSW25_05235 [Sulfitobacter donghicola DSW-25 = KCTC 12864 = JCM 14565]KIN66520.1 hypothetical protein Z948_218 [Sulfitobacter donghicola DSW-25 = KCTC 12864 = JCM 14565]